jgi:hypothetical protein
MPATDPAGVLEREPALGLLAVAVPVAIAEVRALTEAARLALAAEAGQYIAEHGDDLMFRSKAGRSADAFTWLARGLACAAYQPGGVSFAGMHWCTARCCRCHDTGVVYVHACTCGGTVNAPAGVDHERDCGTEPCPRGCELPAEDYTELPIPPEPRAEEDVPVRDGLL